MLNKEQIAIAADRLYAAETGRQQIPALTLDYPQMDMADAYAIQKQWVDRKVDEGRVVKGYKIGLTSRAMQMAVNIDEPDYGVLLDDMFFEDGATLNAADFLDPRIEVELAFVLKKPLFGENVSVIDVLNATDYVMPALELIAARCQRTHPETGYTRKVFDTIADNAANAGVILGGRPIRPTDIDLRWAGALLYLNGQIEETGIAAGVLGHPAKGISWVCKRFAPHGIGLEPGQVILAGSFTRPVPVKAGDTVHADYGPLGGIAINFA
ncbi:2-oxo-hepta-3-ene-1,7-dioic acid hydratase [Marinobacterium nitratireducens]|uniref:2-oxo-hepta-3-ene-1,7-dioic acid hydratase n=1 Tax=Marinobacterium nitratireducens TaxID=518897 RepID=A0A917ZB28_9GAMM|nr:2-oxo-hepta-3-ene-1,7-dioic acid hydratase [Marinobacterium nitratireducens]GGO79825.1 2-oxo-hepta-3-ene-1,7-dioic acid hydratase [Marinobacterium nitratireducens]